MVVEIVRPVFKCAEDEAIFFSRLYELGGYERIIDGETNLRLLLIAGYEKSSMGELQEICDTWNTTFSVLSR